MKDDIFNKISPSEALEILRQLANTDKQLKKRIVELAEDLFRNVDVEAVGNDVFDALDGIDVQELWDRSGPKRDGYTSPEEMAAEMFEEALEPFLQDLYRLFNLKMHQEAKLACMGILKGIYEFGENSGSEFKEWANDVPEENFGHVLNEWWKKRNSKIKDKKEMKDFISNEFSAWSEWAIKQI
jgi:hypothetical protein